MLWTELTAAPPIQADQVHVWRVHIQRLWPRTLEYNRLLSESERVRAARFVFPADRQNHVAARGALRVLLGGYLGIDPSAVSIETNPYGKPLISEPSNPQGLTFNLSHSGGLCLIAVGIKCALGIDIERIRNDVSFMELSQRYFAKAEIEELAGLEPSAREEAFWLAWTRKEAYVKARGEGLQIPLNQFVVSLDPSQPSRLVSRDSDRWLLFSLSPASSFVAALVVERPERKLRCWDFAFA